MISIAGISTLFVPILKTFALLATYSWIFGFFISANYTLTTIMVVELLGMEQLTNAYGFVSLSEGLANLIGVPLAGLYSFRFSSVLLLSYIHKVPTFLEKLGSRGMSGNFENSLESQGEVGEKSGNFRIGQGKFEA